MKIRKLLSNPYLFFLPLLLIYLIFIIIVAKTEFHGDEKRYLTYANNLAHGFYSYPAPFLDLGNGPGYPLILTPFVALQLPLIFLKLLNAIFYYFSLIFLFKSLKKIVPEKFALIFSLVWGLYPNTFKSLEYILPEVFTSSLVPIFIFFVTNIFDYNDAGKKRGFIIGAGITMGYIALTKPIFGYVIIAMILGIAFLFLTNHHNKNYKRSLAFVAVAFLVTIPWLGYTYHMTGKILYWSSYGGNNLYWMSSPYENEFGDYMTFPFQKNPELLPGSNEKIEANHSKDFEAIWQDPEAQKLYIASGKHVGSIYTGVIQDDILKKTAIDNIKTHPKKFIENCIANVGRMIFNYPSSYVRQKPSTLRRLPINGTLLVLSAFCLVMTLMYWKKLLFHVRFLILFALIYFGGSILGSAEPRMFTVIVPILLFWIAYVLYRTVKIQPAFID